MSVQNLEKEFSNPTAAFRAKPFWAWNDKLESDELRRQIRLFRQMGFGGFFMHSRVGLKTPYLSEEWFSLIEDCIDEAAKAHAQAWLYDEDRWPSGPAGGLVTKDPKYQAHYLALTRHTHPERFDWPKDEAAFVFGAVFEDDQISWYKKLDQPADILILPQGAEILKYTVQTPPPIPWFNDTAYLDTLSREAVAKFIEVTHEVYLKRVGRHFGKVVPGIFTDEPNGGPLFRNFWEHGSSIPWTDELPRRFEELFGYDIVPHIPEIGFEIIGKPDNEVRYHYHRCRTRLFVENFMKQIGDWCEKHGILLTGHVLEEQPVSNNVSCVGSAMQCYPYMQAPGVDMLTQYNPEYISVKQVSSVARQMGRTWVLSELYGCTGWEATFEMYKHSGDWQAALGITLRCPHLSWYSMAGEAKRDYPASIHFHSPWWKHYKFVEDYFSRLNVVLTAGEPVCDLAVIHPVESYYLLYGPNWETDPRLKKMDAAYSELVAGLLGAHLDFDFADEQLMVELGTKVETDAAGAYLQIGKMKYRAILVPPLLTIRKSTLDLLGQFAAAGGKVVFAGDPAGLVDAKASDEVKTLAQGRTVGTAIPDIANALQDKARRVSIRDAQGQEAKDVFYQFRKVGDDWVLLMVNTNRQTGYPQLNVRLTLDLPRGGQIQVWDAATGRKFKLAGELTFRSAAFRIDLAASGSQLIVISSQPADLPPLPAPRPTGKEIRIGDEGWGLLLDDYNVIVLDRPDGAAQAEGKKKLVKPKTEILQLDRDLRDYLGLRHRGGDMVQPWVSKDQPLGPTAAVTLTYKFAVKQVPTGPVLLAIEQPERWRIRINDQPVDSNLVNGWWVDPAIKTLAIDPAILARGKNTLVLEGQFDRLTDLEAIFILGGFGAETDGKNVSITRPSGKIGLGSWVNQGLPFYSGNVTYRTTFDMAPEPNVRYLLKLPSFKATGVEISLNGKAAGILAWPDHQVDVTEFLAAGKNTIDIKVLGSRRNAFGPLHLAVDKPSWTGPGSFIANPENPQEWQDDYSLRDYGLYEPPVLVACEG